MKKQLFIALMAISMTGVLMGSDALAQASYTPAPGTELTPRPEPGMGKKFGRGVVNVLTCWTEIPRNVAIEYQRTDPASGLFLGVGKGLGYGYTRFMGGMFDIITFPFPVPTGFAPVTYPEYPVHDHTRDVAQPIQIDQLAMDMDEKAPARDYTVAPTSRAWP